MTNHHLPLYFLFNALRRQGWTLGIDDYLTAVEILKTGIIVGNSQAKELEQLCSWLWAKSPEQKEIIYQICQQIKNSYQVELPTPEAKTVTIPSQPPQKTKIPPLVPPRIFPRQKIEPIVKDYTIPLSEDAQEYAIAAKLKDIEESETSTSSRSFILRREYFPVTPRQMKQSWRSLRRLVREGKPEELDLDATIAKISREGILSEPILQPRRINRADLILFVDQQGSMVPFHLFSRQLVETAQRGGKLRQADVYYFHNCPGSYVFEQPNLFNRKSLTDIWGSLDNRAVVLIVSDAGAAREHYDSQRIEQTQKFIQQLKKAVRYCAWLNPMPAETWQNTSAAVLSQFIPMFSMDRQGLNNAIAILRGRYVKGEIPLS